MIPYDVNYYYNLLKIHTNTAEDIVKKRYEFIKEALIKDGIFVETMIPFTMLDYGCGVGFMKVFKPEWVGWVDTFDIMPVPQTGITRKEYDIISMYDVLEHIPDFKEVEPVLKRARYVVISVPVKPSSLPWSEYKHFKPSEHLHYFTHDLLDHIFDHMEFKKIAHGQPECPPRQYIDSFVYKNNNY